MIKMFQKISTSIIVMSSLIFLSGCDIIDDDDDNTNNDVGTAKVQVIHASPDAPAVNVWADGNSLLENFDYAEASPRLEVNEGELTVEIQGIFPDGTTPTVIGPATLDLTADMLYTAIAVGEVAEIDALIVAREDSDINAGELRAQVVHAAPNAPMVDVYVTEPGADLTTTAALGTFSFEGSLGPVDVPEDTYQIRVTLAGDPETVVFDSGSLELTSGLDLTIAAIENTLTGESPINLLVTTNSSSFIVQDVDATADLRVVHASPDAPAVDVLVNDETTLVSNLDYAEATGFVGVPADTYNVKVVPTGEVAPVVIDADLTLDQGTNYTVLAVDLLETIEPLVITEDRRSVATEAKVQIIHASPAAGNVDIYVTAPGAGIADVDPTFSDVPFKGTTEGFVSLPVDSYDITVTLAGTKDAAIGPAELSFEAGGVYTIIARDAQRLTAEDSGLPPSVILLDFPL
ncbi:DUF4397 domain-containing protein [Pleionea sediminis]|uniref:DUF4397 domain-containing protein n=1 Tax=Pleionea sediminis TaxID=2569479 RepID=UPI00118615D2|nr:DUF4397 domain-containing protein [Pleionea sediminis]